MANSLGLDDDLDGVELVQTIQKAFEIEITAAEAERILIVGELYDLLLTKIPVNEVDRKCAGAITFYRLRRAIKNFGYVSAISPSSDLSFLEAHRARTIFRQLEQQTGLRLPRLEITYAGFLGCLTVALSFFAVLGFSVFAHRSFFSRINGVALAAIFIAVGWGFLYFDPGKLPESCATLGGLARKVAALNYGRLIRRGANHRGSEIWKHLIELLSDYALPKSEISRDTYFLQSQFRKKVT